MSCLVRLSVCYTEIDWMCLKRLIPPWSVCLFIGLSVCHVREPYKNGWTDPDAVLWADSCGSKIQCLRVKIRRIYLHTQGVTSRRCGLSSKILWPLVLAISDGMSRNTRNNIFTVLVLVLVLLSWYCCLETRQFKTSDKWGDASLNWPIFDLRQFYHSLAH